MVKKYSLSNKEKTVMKKKYIQPSIEVIRSKVGHHLLNTSPYTTPQAASTNIEGLSGYNSSGEDAGEAW